MARTENCERLTSDFFRNRLVAVTGATGLSGSYIVKDLAEMGANVRAVTHRRPFTEFTKLASEFVTANLMEAESTRSAVKGAEIVIHAGGVTGGIAFAMGDPAASVYPNAIIATQVVDACAKEKVQRLCLLSSTTVYPPSDRPVKEDEAWTGEPDGAYYGIGWVKRFSEKLCRFYSEKYGLQVAIVRPAAIYGRFDDFDEGTSHVIPAMIARAVSGADPFVVWGDGGDVRDFLHASDLAQGALLAVEKHANCDALNIASGDSCSTGDLAKMVLDAVGSTARVRFDPTKPAAIRVRKVDISKARSLLGYSPRVSLREGISDTVAWYKSRLQ